MLGRLETALRSRAWMESFRYAGDGAGGGRRRVLAVGGGGQKGWLPDLATDSSEFSAGILWLVTY